MLAVGAGVLVIALLVTAFLIVRPGSKDDPVADPTGTTGVTSTATEGSEVTDSTASTDSTGYNGKLYCWDSSTAEPGETCPPLAGLAALQWVFPARASAAQPTCTPEPSTAIPESYRVTLLEYFKCVYPDLPNSSVYLGRWLDAGSARAAMNSIMTDATGATSEPYDNNNAKQSAGVDGTVWNGTDSTSDEKRFSFVYNSQPFTLELVIDDSTGDAETELTKWNDLQQFRYADGVGLGGSSEPA